MQLIAILLITVSILTFLSGLAVFLGASKADKIRSAWFFAATIFATIWTVAISLFLIATPNWNGALTLIVDMTYISAIFIDIALLGYISWLKKYGKTATLVFFILGLIFAGVFIAKPIRSVRSPLRTRRDFDLKIWWSKVRITVGTRAQKKVM